MYLYCSKCGKKNGQTTTHCHSCGTPLDRSKSDNYLKTGKVVKDDAILKDLGMAIFFLGMAGLLYGIIRIIKDIRQVMGVVKFEELFTGKFDINAIVFELIILAVSIAVMIIGGKVKRASYRS